MCFIPCSEEKTQRVTNVIVDLGIEKCKDTIIGGFMRRGVSGGERKRVSVGHELLINPSIIFLDEPTSGLDSTTALALVSTLEQLAAGGRSVVTTIHQPSSRMFQKLEKLMLLSEGRVLYYGYNEHCVEWFQKLGTPCPFGVNIADFILDLANANQGITKEDGQTIRAQQVNAFKAFADREDYNMETGIVKESLEIAAGLVKVVSSKEMHTGNGALMDPSSQGSQIISKIASHLSISNVAKMLSKEDVVSERAWGATWGTQFAVLFSRSIKTRRFDSLGIERVSQLLGVAIIAGMFYFQLGGKDTVKSARDVAGLLFFQLLFPSINSMFSALFVFPSVTQMVMKERQSGMYRLSAFYLSHTLSDLPMDCFLPTLFIFITYFMGGLRLTAQAWFFNWMAIMLSLLTTQSLGLALGAGVTDVKVAQTVATIILLTVMLAGGYFVTYVPPWIAWVKYVSFIYYGYMILMHIEFKGRTIYDCPLGSEPPSESCIEVTDLKTSLGLAQDPNDSVALPVGILFLMLVTMRVGIYCILNNKTKQRR
jgi:ABC-type multidrug transport system ATPase subunit